MLSEQYGLKVDLCLECHRFGKHAVHKDHAVMDELHRQGQEAFESQVGSRKETYENIREELPMGAIRTVRSL